ncbi:hypothetical protein BDBG_16894 [Blastomyces gilchristii SLH14081]|uniref:Uncharacterized protein n=1 Tax=Blastomyces gilchristii (strain SLH14081) TaxID=559298 RepID=A0A179UKR2_BLAGS|nr:uncharacterized protein BDBG_16894 [Blastomyces gilchristii SLH14081]OAT07828.1 hypothetical protein BDBG_16894 [Blastomyces gilchristii SLH14081]
MGLRPVRWCNSSLIAEWWRHIRPFTKYGYFVEQLYPNESLPVASSVKFLSRGQNSHSATWSPFPPQHPSTHRGSTWAKIESQVTTSLLLVQCETIVPCREII